MPIAIKDFQWDETERMVYVTVPLKGVKPKRVDIFSTEEYIKVSYPPYIFECLLYAPVYDKNATAEIGNGAVIFKLEKQEPRLWLTLLHPDASDKAKLKERKEKAILRSQERAEEEKKERTERKREADKFSVTNQMRLEQQEKSRIEDVKTAERVKATQELEEWKKQQKLLAELEKIKVSDDLSARNSKFTNEIEKNMCKLEKEAKKSKSNTVKSTEIFEDNAGDQPMREVGKIQVSFTERVFPTAARESTAEKEDEWLKKQAEARRMTETEDAELREHEKDPVWLKEKGDEFFKQGNYHAAINAFSHGIRINFKMPSLYSNRGACHLKLGNYFKCAEDCSRALELLTPPVPQNASSRVRAHVRRGTAYCNLELFVEGLQDYEVALKIDPNNELVKADAHRIRQIIQGSDLR